jgi:hypothetical protein
MRKIILVAAIVLASVSARADGVRSLSLASAGDTAAAQQVTTSPAQATETAKPADAPEFVERPSAVSTTAPVVATTTAAPTSQAPATTAAKPAPQTTAKTDKPRHKRTWTEGRVISELHRHGIYW